MSGRCDNIIVLKGDKGDTGPAAPISYLVYTALLTQVGTNAPTAIVLQNTLGGTLVWSYISTGRYNVTLTNVFTNNKTAVFFGPILANDVEYTRDFSSTSVVRINTADGGVLTNELLDNTEFEIRVYP